MQNQNTRYSSLIQSKSAASPQTEHMPHRSVGDHPQTPTQQIRQDRHMQQQWLQGPEGRHATETVNAHICTTYQ